MKATSASHNGGSALSELAKRIAESRALVASGNRVKGIVEARRAVAKFPFEAESYRNLGYILSHENSYRYHRAVCKDLVASGAIEEVLQCARRAISLERSEYEDFLQAGYCLTALGKYAEAAANIREATDMHMRAINPGVFAGMNETWEALIPRFLVIGVAKAGTTSLYDYITWHPRVLPAIVKEMNYFGAPERGWEWYLSHFPRRPAWEHRFITGEARVGNFDDWTAPRLVKDVLPDVKLIALLRNPADRAISHYYNDRRLGVEDRSLEDAFDQELSLFDGGTDESPELSSRGRSYLRLGLYAKHLMRWMKEFSADELLILISEEFFSAPDREMRKVFKYLGLNEYNSRDYKARNLGSYDNQSKGTTRARLMEFFGRHNEDLFALLGRRIDWS